MRLKDLEHVTESARQFQLFVRRTLQNRAGRESHRVF